jgi:hypothetical protein
MHRIGTSSKAPRRPRSLWEWGIIDPPVGPFSSLAEWRQWRDELDRCDAPGLAALKRQANRDRAAEPRRRALCAAAVVRRFSSGVRSLAR